MAKRDEKRVLFLCTGNYFRSRFSEVLFNSVAAKFGLAWKATSRGLALERGTSNVGPMAKTAVKTLASMGVRATDELTRLPQQVAVIDFEQSHYLVALQRSEHEPLLQERHPEWIPKVEFWDVPDEDAASVTSLMEQEVMDLVARLLAGGKPRQARPTVNAAPQSPPAKNPTANKAAGAVVKVGRETKGRRGKGVTIVWEVPLDEAGLLSLTTQLKQRCGTGGTLKDQRIEIQGDQRERICAELEALGYRVKRVGG